MKTVLVAAAIVAALASPASAQVRCSGFNNGMGFCYGPNGAHETYTFRNGVGVAQGSDLGMPDNSYLAAPLPGVTAPGTYGGCNGYNRSLGLC